MSSGTLGLGHCYLTQAQAADAMCSDWAVAWSGSPVGCVMQAPLPSADVGGAGSFSALVAMGSGGRPVKASVTQQLLACELGDGDPSLYRQQSMPSLVVGVLVAWLVAAACRSFFMPLRG